jgi:hypothetical protein
MTTDRDTAPVATEEEIVSGVRLAKQMVSLIEGQRPAVQLAACKAAAAHVCKQAAKRYGMSEGDSLRYFAHMLTGGNRMSPDEYASAANISFSGRAAAVLIVNPAWPHGIGATVHQGGDQEAAQLLALQLRELGSSLELSLASEKKPAQA